jgi:phosphatidylinositol alpha 1,6-mannosyltransferase
MRPPRVAFFTDSFHEVNGVAHTSRNFAAFAHRRGLPFLSVRAGSAPPTSVDDFHTLELPRSRTAISLEKDLHFDPLFFRHARIIDRALRAFRPDVLHITGPSELGLFGAYFAWRHRIPLAASWHTNIHEYAGRRMHWLTRHLSPNHATRLEKSVERLSLSATVRFYRLARVLFAPNPDLCTLLERLCNRPCHLMQRGVDTDLFTPARRSRNLLQTPLNLDETPLYPDENTLLLGFVGRLSIEKNVSLLPRIQASLRHAGIINTRFLIVGQGGLEAQLHQQLPDAIFAGVLRGKALAEAYSNMDLLVFPSHTDTFGNVVLEALASGVPAVVTPDGGPCHIVRPDTGYIVEDEGFASAIANLLQDPAGHQNMRLAARAYALTYSWDAVFEKLYTAYKPLITNGLPA